jgi:2-aminoadipate transaminase
VGEADIREGVRRIGEVISEQVALFSTMTGEQRSPARATTPAPAAAPQVDETGRVLPLRPRRAS